MKCDTFDVLLVCFFWCPFLNSKFKLKKTSSHISRRPFSPLIFVKLVYFRIIVFTTTCVFSNVSFLSITTSQYTCNILFCSTSEKVTIFCPNVFVLVITNSPFFAHGTFNFHQDMYCLIDFIVSLCQAQHNTNGP